MKNWKRIPLALVALAGASFASAQQSTPTLKVGDAAPAIKVGKWVKGTAVPAFAPGKVYVVEFWATWCGPCKMSIPHLTKMAHKYKGKVTFTGVSVYEESDKIENGTWAKYEARVASFVKSEGAQMDYHVAFDTNTHQMAKKWMEAAGQNGIPTAFVVKNGKVLWIGHPMMGLDETLGKILAGKFDAKKEAQAQQAEMDKEQASQAEQQQKLQPILQAYGNKDYKGAVTEMDKLFAKDPESEKNLFGLKVMCLMESDVPGANEYIKGLSEGMFKDDPININGLAWMMVDDKTTKPGVDYALAESLATKALGQLDSAKDSAVPGGVAMNRAATLDTLAYAQYRQGKTADAVANEEKAVALGKSIGAKMDPKMLKEIEDRLEIFKAKKV